ncbi:hypothetical protein SKAU_G00222730 [Synaphobranchus kaupii]|uniref:Uncharacterized protein n=1 Tax=Synaphobranchus kaupii TaxID=118154 RepID=A0A9Q1IW10_SYNKA|nr:hypothetical protein SKAU_G00222730 [Synaphobranchus kaupii]
MSDILCPERHKRRVLFLNGLETTHIRHKLGTCLLGFLERTQCIVKKREDPDKENAAMTETVAELNSLRDVVQKTKSECWFQADSAQSQRGMQLTVEKETSLGNKALIMVRRAALQSLLEQEQRQYSMELGLIQKAFYQQRI